MSSTKTSSSDQTIQEIQSIFKLQKKTQYQVARSTSRDRIKNLNKLQDAITKSFKDDIREAMYQDFKKPAAEVEMTEIFPIVAAIKHAKNNLAHWMQDEGVRTPLAFLGFSSKIKYEPKGVSLIISPWNFPFNLTFIPLVSAIAAGNTVMIKPSEHTPRCSKVMKLIIDEIYDKQEVALFEGTVPETTALLELPFNHIFFTGSPQVGKIVMTAAAKNLTSVCLELGGKSPTIVDKSANLKAAAAKISWAKGMNNGQVCIAPDYLMIHEDVKEEFLRHYKSYNEIYYSKDPKSSASYCRIVNQNHFNRLNNYLVDASEHNAKIEIGGHVDPSENYIEPTVVSGLKEDALLWKEEVFGPILPIRTFKNINETIDYINSGEKPLALYIYSKNKKNIKNIIDNTRSGGVVVNYSTTHYSNPYLPFGGSNNSGIGKGNGFYGFKSFSNLKAVQKHWSPIDTLSFLRPPFTPTKFKLIQIIRKWLA